MPTFQDLANENIIEIIRFCKPANLEGIRITQDTLCNLRLVSQRLNALVCPILFATLRLEFLDSDDYFRTEDYSRRHEILIALTTRSTTVFEHTRKLIMHTEKLFWTYESTTPDIAQAKKYLNERISNIISALKNLRSIEYFYNPIFDPQQLVVNLIHALAKLPSFENVGLHFVDNLGWYTNMPQSITLKPLSNLTVFRTSWIQSKSKPFILEIASLLARCPNMIEFALDQLSEKGATLHQLLQNIDAMETEWKLERLILRGVAVTPKDIKDHIHHFKNLAFLGISNNEDPKASTTFGQICNILQENAIFLKGVSTDHPEDSLLLHYLSSYSGLEKLCLHMEDGQVESESEIIDQVYTRVLPKHFETIQHLELGSKESRVWGEIPTRGQLVELARCRNLKSLEVHSKVCLDELRKGCNDNLDVYISSLNVKASFETTLDRI